ncbi:MAG: UDP-N-acetylglucosamine 2-epimerase (non-hydrolyzing) [Caldisericia bacterium]|nr:UDP-N-acetylglucosamine 2-epimerase (non-hydrolyzing) [Caldisericia bacterium]HOJ15847.1 UDP-N-acetylglucosamine 2-epimerase (non-hydrolyzing) [Caldisericia bacterium]HPO28924.1 UDP-N-acetylglucosamine 2-epimerase (non-hydrolyzing) [Caldisericia bacterium]
MKLTKPKVLFTFGTRPEAIKMAPVISAFMNDDSIITKIVLTAQHREMLDQVLSIFDIKGDYDYNIMTEKQSLEFITTSVLERFTSTLKEESPDLVFVHGDTTTTFASALASFYQNIPVAHIEAGLRSWDLRNPYPEEMNRKLADSLSDLHFCPTKTAKDNLIKENVKSKGIYITGNTVVDALTSIIKVIERNNYFVNNRSGDSKIILLTMHRRESLGDPMKEVMESIRDVIIQNKDSRLIFPVHKNPYVREIVFPVFEGVNRVELIEPLDYLSFIKLMKESYIIVSDSGGIQEEAPTLKKPVLLTRKVTERPEGIESGVVKLVGTDSKTIKRELNNLLNDKDYYESFISKGNPFGDGNAALRILKYIKIFFNLPINSESLSKLGEFD